MGWTEARIQFRKDFAKHLGALLGVLQEDWSEGIPRTDKLELIANCFKALRLFTGGAGSVDAIVKEYPQFLNQIVGLIKTNGTNNIIQQEVAQIVKFFTSNDKYVIPDELHDFVIEHMHESSEEQSFRESAK